MQVKSIAKCLLGAFCNTFDLHLAIIGLMTVVLSNFEWPLKTGFTVSTVFNRHRKPLSSSPQGPWVGSN